MVRRLADFTLSYWSTTQWAAVTMNSGLTMEPPQPGRPSAKRTTCHGHEFGDAFDPPITRLVADGLFPHWAFAW